MFAKESPLSEFAHKISMVKVRRDDIASPPLHYENHLCEDYIIEEQRIAFYLNDTKLLSVMSMPKDQDAHLVGFLMSEGVLDSVDNVISLEIAPDGLSVRMQAHIKEEKLAHLHKEKTLTTGCCVGVSANFEGEIVQKFIATPMNVPISRVFTLLDVFNQPTELFSLTGCVHKAMLVLEDEKYLISEDVGRHNAIDKVIGKARLAGFDITQSILIVSGRLSMEMVIKAAMHSIPIIVSRSATTYLGIKSAQLLGITLIGFARGDALNIYAHPARIVL